MDKKIIIITAPSGSGKTTLVKQLLALYPRLAFSISACTRSPRQGETNGLDYYFLQETDFRQKIEENAFLEWEMVYTGKYYGTLNEELERIWNNHQYPLVDIDVHGALSIKNKFPATSMSLFIKAPSMDVLRERLVARGTETQETLSERLEKAKAELTYAPLFDHIIVNDDLHVALQEMIQIIDLFLNQG
jgi:guanylate kinase